MLSSANLKWPSKLLSGSRNSNSSSPLSSKNDSAFEEDLARPTTLDLQRPNNNNNASLCKGSPDYQNADTLLVNGG